MFAGVHDTGPVLLWIFDRNFEDEPWNPCAPSCLSLDRGYLNSQVPQKVIMKIKRYNKKIPPVFIASKMTASSEINENTLLIIVQVIADHSN